jgi:RNA polymerase sigma-70 factor (ECF subfamily)
MPADDPDHQATVPAGSAFATTRWSVVLEAGNPESADLQQALEILCRAYWPAVHAYIRRTGKSPEEARDLTQEFFARLLAKGWLSSADRERGRFRTFLLTLVQRFLADEHDRETALKRGGGQLPFSLDEFQGEDQHPLEPSITRTPEQEFDRRWALATLENTLRRLRAEAELSGQNDLFAELQGFLAGGEPRGALTEAAQRLGLGESAVKMRISRWRARYRELLRQEVAHTVPRFADVEEEMRHLLSALTH